MRLIMISTDRQIFDENSSVRKRMVEYGKIFDELHIIVFSLSSHGFRPFSATDKAHVYPTNSSSRFSYIKDAIRIGKGIAKAIYFGQTAISAQDPFEAGIAGAIIKMRTKLPLQIQIHTDFYSREFYDGSLSNWLRFEISRFTLPMANGVRVVRDKIADDLVSHFKIKKEKITVLPIFVDINKIRDYPISLNLHIKYPQWGQIALVASRLSPEKNIPLILRAFKKSVSQNPDVGLVVVGQGSQEEKLKDLSRKLNIEGHIAFESWQQNLFSYYKTADLFLSASDFEGYGMTLVEAAAAGCPVLTTNVGIAQDLFVDGKNALVCPTKDEKCFSNKLITLFSNPSIQRSLVESMSSDIEKIALTREEYFDRFKKSFDTFFP